MAHHGCSKSISLPVVPRNILALIPIAIALGLALFLQRYLSVRGVLLPTSIVVSMWYSFAIVLSVACLLCM